MTIWRASGIPARECGGKGRGSSHRLYAPRGVGGAPRSSRRSGGNYAHRNQRGAPTRPRRLFRRHVRRFRRSLSPRSRRPRSGRRLLLRARRRGLRGGRGLRGWRVFLRRLAASARSARALRARRRHRRRFARRRPCLRRAPRAHHPSSSGGRALRDVRLAHAVHPRDGPHAFVRVLATHTPHLLGRGRRPLGLSTGSTAP